MHRKSIVFDCERMKYPYTGLYYYCLLLGKALLRQRAENQNLELEIYLPESLKDLFPKVPVITQHSVHKFHMPFAARHDAWHCTYQGSNYFPSAAGCKMILTIHDLNFLYDSKTEAKKKKYLKGLQEKIDRADVITTISKFVKDDVAKNADLRNKQVEVVYNGCNVDEHLLAEAPAIQPAAPFFFTVGTITDKKNFHVLPGLLRNNNFLLLIAGIEQSRSYKQKIIQEAIRLNVAERVLFIGPVKEAEKYWYLQHCSAFAFPSLAEGFGLPVIEAMHFGKPVLLSRATSLPEIGGSHAYYFDDFDATHMSNVALQAIEEHRLYKKEQQVKEWAAQFNWENTAARYWNIYQNLVT